MKRLGLITFLTSLALASFAQNPALKESFLAYPESAINHDGRMHKSYDLIEGSHWVFEFSSNNAGEPGNQSSGNSKWSFQIPMTSDSFKIEGEQLQKSGVLYMQTCLCQDEGISLDITGSIYGVKISTSEWNIAFDLVADGRKTNYQYALNRQAIFLIQMK